MLRHWLVGGGVLALLGLGGQAAAVPLGDVAFADAQLASCLSSYNDTDHVTHLDCKYMNIESLQGIEQLTNLQYLDVVGNGIVDFSPLLSHSNSVAVRLYNNAASQLELEAFSSVFTGSLLNSDLGRPALSNVLFDNTTLNLDAGDQILNMNVTTSDGVAHGGHGWLHSPNSSARLWVNDGSETVIPAAASWGTWPLQLYVGGFAYNHHFLEREGFISGIDFVGSTSANDAQEPVLNSVSFSSGVIDVSDSPQQVTVTLDAVDIGSGFEWVAASIIEPENTTGRRLSKGFEFAEGSAVGQITLSNRDRPGVWQLHNIRLADNAGHDVSPSFSLMLEVINNNYGAGTSPMDISFPDANLQRCVEQSGHTYIEDITGLWCENYDIASLQGIEQLPTLTHLALDHNAIVDISPLYSLPLLEYVHITDNIISQTDLESFAATFTGSMFSDIYRPELASLSLSSSSINVDGGDQLLVLQLDTVDGQPYQSAIKLISPNGLASIDGEFNYDTGEITFVIPTEAAWGRWGLELAQYYSSGSGNIYYSSKTLSLLGFDPYVEVVGVTSVNDSEAPQLEAISIDSLSLDISEAEKSVAIAVQAFDTHSDIEVIELEFSSSAGNYKYFSLPKGQSQFQWDFKRYNSSVTWALNLVTVKDRAGNVVRVYSHDFDPTWDSAFSVINNNIDHGPLVSELVFADANLQACIRNDHSYAIYAYEIKYVTCSNRDIRSLAGIEQLTSLEQLSASGNKITSIAELETLTALTFLSLETNAISDLTPLLSLPNLQTVGIEGNAVSQAGIDSFDAAFSGALSSDDGRPTLTALILSSDTVNMDSGDQRIDVDFTLASGQSPSWSLCLNYALSNAYTCASNNSDNLLDRDHILIPAAAALGEWELTFALQAGDSSYVFSRDVLEALGFTATVAVTGTNSLNDRVQPLVNDFSASATLIDVSAGPVDVTFTLEGRDADSGIDERRVFMWSAGGSIIVRSFDDFDTWTHRFGRNTAPGTYYLSPWAVDNASNVSAWSTDPSWPTSLEVVNSNYGKSAAQSDFNGDGNSDILWHHATQGYTSVWQMNGSVRETKTSVGRLADTNWYIAATGDFDGDGDADVLWRHKLRGYSSMWLMDGDQLLSKTSVGTLSDLDWELVSAADFNGDGKDDLLWHHQGRGYISLWTMDGDQRLDKFTLGTLSDTAWQVAGVADFNGDNKADILWHHEAMGYTSLWQMDGGVRTEKINVGRLSDTDWKVAATADFDADGNADILWHHESRGWTSLWTMDGGSRLAKTSLGTLSDTAWTVAASGDYNGDANADLVWHHSGTGTAVLWQINNAVVSEKSWIGRLDDLSWKIQ